MGPALLVSFYLADADSSAAGDCVGCNRIFAIPHVSSSAQHVRAEGGLRRTGVAAHRAALPSHHHHRENFRAAVDRRDRHDDVDYFRRHDAFQREARVHLSRGGVELVVGFLRRARRGDGEHGLHLLGLLQHLQPRRRNPPTGAQHPARNFYLHSRHRRALPFDADEHPGRAALAECGRLEIYCQHIHGTHLRRARGARRDGDDSLDCFCVNFFRAAGLHARAVCGGVRRKFLFHFRARASYEAFPVRFAAVSWRRGARVQPAFQAGVGDQGDSRDAVARAIYRAGRGRDDSAAALARVAIAL